jgi:ABC-type dipeptide/oligopeptide/nickel transport system permease subunit
VSTLLLNQTAPYIVLLAFPSILRSAVLNVMAVCVWFMLLALGIVVLARGARSVRAMGRLPKNRVAKVGCSGHSTQQRKPSLPRHYLPLLIPFSGETGSGVFIGEQW